MMRPRVLAQRPKSCGGSKSYLKVNLNPFAEKDSSKKSKPRFHNFFLLSLVCHFLALCGFYVYLTGQPKRSRAKRRLPIEGELYDIAHSIILMPKYTCRLHFCMLDSKLSGCQVI